MQCFNYSGGSSSSTFYYPLVEILFQWVSTCYHIEKKHTHTHTHTHVGFCGLWGLSIGVMVFILNKLCVLLPYTYPTPKLSPHRRLCAFLDFQKNTI